MRTGTIGVTLLGVVVAFCFSALGVASEEAKRLPVPDETSQKAVVDMLREIFGRDMDSRDAEVQTRIAQQLLKQADDPNNDATSRYVALHQAAVFAARSGDAPTAMSALDQMEKQYRAQTAPIRLQVLTHAQRAARAPEEHAQVAQSFANLVFVAIREDDFEVANQAVRNATSSGSRSRNRDLITQLRQLTPLVRDAEHRFRAVSGAFETLESNPDDPQANLAAGRYLCFVKGDWDAGLPHLAKAADKDTAALAQTDLNEPQETESQIAMGDAWFDFAQKQDDETAKGMILVRAGVYYRKASPQLGGMAKMRVQRRVEEIEALISSNLVHQVSIPPVLASRTDLLLSTRWNFYWDRGIKYTSKFLEDGTVIMYRYMSDIVHSKGRYILNDDKLRIDWENGGWMEFPSEMSPNVRGNSRGGAVTAIPTEE